MTFDVDSNTFKDIGKQIEEIVENSGTDYIDAAIDYCQKNNVEIEFIGEVIAKNPNLKAKFEEEAENLNFIQKTARLPI
jgi:hypothetical protein